MRGSGPPLDPSMRSILQMVQIYPEGLGLGLFLGGDSAGVASLFIVVPVVHGSVVFSPCFGLWYLESFLVLQPACWVI